MSGYRVDRIARQVAGAHLSRRVALRAASLGITAAVLRRAGMDAAGADFAPAPLATTVVPLAQSTPWACPEGSRDELFLDGAWLCRQPYALCTRAACERDEHNATTSNCRCIVEDGYSMGYTTCPERKPSGTKLISTFSTQNVTSEFHSLSCPASAPWANCLDSPCEIDPDNPTEALCRCPVVETGPSFTFGGNCDTSTCTSVIWSGAAPPGVTQYAPAMACLDLPVEFPAVCPAATPGAATPGSG